MHWKNGQYEIFLEFDIPKEHGTQNLRKKNVNKGFYGVPYWPVTAAGGAMNDLLIPVALNADV